MTTTQVAKHLVMNQQQVVYWVERGAFPPPSFIDNNGVRYFDQEWLKRAREILERKGLVDKIPAAVSSVS